MDQHWPVNDAGPPRNRLERDAWGPAGSAPVRPATGAVYHAAPRKRRVRWRQALAVSVAVLCVLAGLGAVGAVVIANRFNSAIHRGNLLGDARATPGTDVHGPLMHGPLNFLLIGSNYRTEDPSNGERADTIMIVHVPRDMSRAYLVSVPRDLYYTIKPYAPTHFKGSTEKIDAALNYGGMPLMAQTVSELTGVKFDGAIEARFDGFTKAVEALGGVDMCVDEKTVSVHVGHTRNGKYAKPYSNTGAQPIPVPGVTPQVYYPGCQHLAPWQALDYVRQRELLPNGDYDRQRHQQQFLMAVLKQTASAGTLSDPIKLDRVLHAIGQALTIDTNGTQVTDFAYALKGIKAESLVGVKAPSHPEMIGGTSYVVGEPDLPDLWKAIGDDTLDTYAATHPNQVNPLHTGTAPPPGG
jgi:LCP family protein required for cell wall assembly